MSELRTIHIVCRDCGFDPPNDAAEFCSRCGGKIVTRGHNRKDQTQDRLYVIGGRSGPARPKTPVTCLPRSSAFGDGLPKQATRTTRRFWAHPSARTPSALTSILAGIVYAFGSSHSRLDTIAKSTGISRVAARKAITELERRRFLSHRSRKTWHGRGAYNYRVKRIHQARHLSVVCRSDNSMSVNLPHGAALALVGR